MARARKVEGKCRLCGTVGPLSWEHVPPESAFNNRPIVRASTETLLTPELWDGKRGKTIQRGSGEYTLCERCNNNTGAWYGAEYASWARQGLGCLSRVHPDQDAPFFATFRGFPLRFLKQVVTMFFSVNAEGFADQHPELATFVLDRHATDLPTKYLFDLVLVRGTLSRSSGLYASMDVTTGRAEVASEVAHPPLALRLILAPARDARRGALEQFARFGYDDRRDVVLYTVAGHIITKFPGDYRSHATVLREAAETMAEVAKTHSAGPSSTGSEPPATPSS